MSCSGWVMAVLVIILLYQAYKTLFDKLHKMNYPAALQFTAVTQGIHILNL